jgi:hypothetical protein
MNMVNSKSINNKATKVLNLGNKTDSFVAQLKRN